MGVMARTWMQDDGDRNPVDDRAALRELIRTRSFKTGDFVLSSGQRSTLYFNLKPTMMQPQGAYLSAKAFLADTPSDVDYIGGLEMGAVPIIASLAAIAHVEGLAIQTFFVRKKAKAHGARLLVEGLADGESLRGKTVLIADDVTTSGNSVLQAVEAAREAGAIVPYAMSLVDRLEGAQELLSTHGVELRSIFTAKSFIG